MYNVYRIHKNGEYDFLFSFETLENAQIYLENKKRQSPYQNFLVVKK